MYELDNNDQVNKLKDINLSTILYWGSVILFSGSLLSIIIAAALFFYNLIRHYNNIANPYWGQELLRIFDYTPDIEIWIFILLVCSSIIFGALGWWARYMYKFPHNRPKLKKK